MQETLDAGFEDPFIKDILDEIGSGAEAAFKFVRDQIAFEAYEGSLRGARGTIWSKAGNSLDQSSLMIALLRAQGIPCRYARGTLDTERAQQLILSMFPIPTRVIGCVPEDAQRADPANDPQLLSEVRDHFWVEFDTGNGYVPADPAFAGAQLGIAPVSAAAETFADVPEALWHRVTIRLNVEKAGGFAGTPPNVQTKIEASFTTAELVGKPLTLGHFVQSDSAKGLLGGTLAHTYAPFLVIGQNDAEPSDDPLIRGEDYQEFVSGFPFASELLSGVFIEIDVRDPSGKVETFERTLIDRIGFDLRMSGGLIEGDFTATEPAFSPFDLVTIHVLSSEQSAEAAAAQAELVQPLQEELGSLRPGVQALPKQPPFTSEQIDLLNRAADLNRRALAVLGASAGPAFALASENFLSNLQKGYLTKTYPASPRVVLAISAKEGDRMTFKLDLRKNDLRTLPFPGQLAMQNVLFEMARGFLETSLEGKVLSAITGHEVVSVSDIFGRVTDLDGIKMISNQNVEALEKLSISRIAKARMAKAINDGRLVLTPIRMVQLNPQTEPAIGWFEIDWASGRTIGVMPDGGHQALAEYSVLLFSPDRPENLPLALFIGNVHGFSSGAMVFLGEFLTRITSGESAKRSAGGALVSVISDSVTGVVGNAIGYSVNVFGGEIAAEAMDYGLATVDSVVASGTVFDNPSESAAPIAQAVGDVYSLHLPDSVSPFITMYNAGVVGGMGMFMTWFAHAGQFDPPIFPFLSTDILPGPQRVPPGNQPAVDLKIVRDEPFYLLHDGMRLPFVFRAQVQNRGPVEEVFEISASEVSDSWLVDLSVPQIRVPPGETGEVGICLRPRAQLPPPGADGFFTIRVMGTRTAGLSATATHRFQTPAVPGLRLQVQPTQLSTAPGQSNSVTLTLKSTGNIPLTNLAFEVHTSSNLVVTGLTPPQRITPGESAIQTFNVRPLATAALNSGLVASIKAVYDANSQPPKSTIGQVGLRVTTPDTVPAVDAAFAANKIDRLDLGVALDRLAMALSDLAQSPNNRPLRLRATDLLRNLRSSLSSPGLSRLAPEFRKLELKLISGSENDLPQTLNELSSLFALLLEALSSSENLPFELILQPNTAVAQPLTPARFEVYLRNATTAPRTFQFVLSPLPPGVTASFNRTNVTLAAGESIPYDGGPNVTLSITPAADELDPFEFTVHAFPEGATNLVRSATGALVVRNELVSIAKIEVDPAFADPGSVLNIRARLLNAVNQPRQVAVAYQIRDSSSAVVFTSPPTSVELGIETSLQTIEFPPFSTTGLMDGSYTIEVRVTETGGETSLLGTGEGSFTIGSPIIAVATVTPAVLPSGEGTVDVEIRLTNLAPDSERSIELIGLVDTPAEARSVLVVGNLAYVGGSESLTVVDIDDVENPRIIATVAEEEIADAFSMAMRISGRRLVVVWQELLNVEDMHVQAFDLADPRQPRLIINTTVNQRFLSGLFSAGDHAFVSTALIQTIGADNTVLGISGDFFSLNLNDPADPQVGSILSDEIGRDLSLTGEAAQVSERYALLATSGCNFRQPLNCSGELLVVDISNPANLIPIGGAPIADTSFLSGVAVQGSLALVVGSSGAIPDQIDLADPNRTTGPLMLTTVDVSDPRAPKILQTRTGPVPMASTGSRAVALGHGLFAVSNNVLTNDEPALVLVDANNPREMVVDTLSTPARVNGMQVNGRRLFLTSNAGLGIYNISRYSGIQTRTRIEVPKESLISPALEQNLALRPGATPTASSNFPGFTPARALDGDLNTSWFTTQGGALNQGGAPFFEVALPQPSTVSELRLFGNRGSFANGFDIIAGRFQLFDSAGQTLFDSGGLTLPLPDRDIVVPVPSVNGAARFRFTPTEDEGTRSGFSELEIIGFPDDLADTPHIGALDPPAANVSATNGSITLEWAHTLATATDRIIRWGARLRDLRSGEARRVILGGTVEFTTPGGTSGQIELPPLVVGVEQILSLKPAQQQVRAGEIAEYKATLRNPSDRPATFELSVQGLPQDWLAPLSSVTVEAQGQIEIPLTLNSGSKATPGEYGFMLTAVSPDGARGQVQGTLEIENAPPVPPATPGALVQLSPAVIPIGPGTSAQVRVRLTNTGFTSARFELSTTLPAEYKSVFERETLDLPPGLDSFREISLVITAPLNAPPGAIPFRVNATATERSELAGEADAQLDVAAHGLTVALTPSSAAPGGLFQIELTNTGTESDSFNLDLGGPAAVFAALERTNVSLAPGASASIPINVAENLTATPGPLPLSARAISIAQTNIQGRAGAVVQMPALHGFTAGFEPAEIGIPAPGPLSAFLLVRNTGNVEETFAPEIVNVSGPLTAQLKNSSGRSLQRVNLLRLPALSSGGVPLELNVTGYGVGLVEVRISSLQDPTLTVTAMLRVRSGLRLGVGKELIVELAFDTQPGVDYFLEYRDQVFPPVEWRDLPGGPFNGGLYYMCTLFNCDRFTPDISDPLNKFIDEAILPLRIYRLRASDGTAPVLRAKLALADAAVFDPLPGYDHFVQTTTNLNNPAEWEDLPNGPHNAGLAFYTFQSSQQYFRVKLIKSSDDQ